MKTALKAAFMLGLLVSYTLVLWNVDRLDSPDTAAPLILLGSMFLIGFLIFGFSGTPLTFEYQQIRGVFVIVSGIISIVITVFAILGMNSYGWSWSSVSTIVCGPLLLASTLWYGIRWLRDNGQSA